MAAAVAAGRVIGEKIVAFEIYFQMYLLPVEIIIGSTGSSFFLPLQYNPMIQALFSSNIDFSTIYKSITGWR